MPRILIIGYFGFNNAGDELMLDRLLGMIRETRLDAEVTVLSGNPLNTRRKHRVEAIPYVISDRFERWRTLVRCIARSDVLIFGGGTFLQDYGIRSWHPIAYYLKLVIVARLLRKKVGIIGSGVGPLTTSMGRRISRWIVDLANIAIMRDRDSIRLLSEIGTSARHIQLGADLVVPSGKMSPTVVSQAKSKRIGLSFFPFFSYVFGDFQQQTAMTAEIVAFLKALAERFEIFFFCFQEDVDGADNLFAINLAAVDGVSFQTVLYSEDSDRFLERLGEMDLVIGMRYHFILLAILAGIPSVAVSYHPKVTSLMAEFGLSDAVIQVNSFTAASALKLLFSDACRKAECSLIDDFVRRGKVNSAALHALISPIERNR